MQENTSRGDRARVRLRLDLRGAVQGVGFRPFVHRLAVTEGLAGFVHNTGYGAALEVEGPAGAVERFRTRLRAELRAPARIDACEATWPQTRGSGPFVIAPSASGSGQALVLPDLATCPACLAEIHDPCDRRFRYAFTTCTHCGPRYSLIAAVPYDRARTTMRGFAMCPACQAEYDDPASRRFHAQTNACPDCGPRLALWDAAGRALAEGDAALLATAEAIRQGQIVGLKGLGGFQLVADARNPEAVALLRARKHRPTKPFAVMVESLAALEALAETEPAEAELLASAAAPIVLLPLRAEIALAAGIAPGNPLIGAMLPTTPLHHLLLAELGFPILATSGNRGGEPIVTDEASAPQALAGLADLFLIHDRAILRRVDDSVVRLIAGRPTVLRHARGYAPQTFAASPSVPLLALGGHLKSAVALSGSGIVLGSHIGDLDTPAARAALDEAATALPALYGLSPQRLACDLHRDYYSTRLADTLGPPVTRVPHHLAHVLACRLDNGLDGTVLGVAWDGTGDGGDGTVWGGEFLVVGEDHWRRAAHLAQFRLPGGEAAMREPRRAGLGALFACHGAAAMEMADIPAVAAFSAAERQTLDSALSAGVNAPLTSSAGRLFDAVAAILGLMQRASFEGEAAMAVEFAAAGAVPAELSPPILAGDAPVVDWRPMLRDLVAARRAGMAPGPLAAAFHDWLATAIVAMAGKIGLPRILLTGGVFQNRRLTEATALHLRAAGFEPFSHHRLPPNDGGLAAGQAAFALHPLDEVTGRPDQACDRLPANELSDRR